jgi:hypothetical protein
MFVEWKQMSGRGFYRVRCLAAMERLPGEVKAAMDDQQKPDNRGFVEHWRRVGPLLERVRLRELRAFDHQANVEIIDALLQMGLQFARERTTSGLVELQKKLHRKRQ